MADTAGNSFQGTGIFELSSSVTERQTQKNHAFSKKKRKGNVMLENATLILLLASKTGSFEDSREYYRTVQ